jgi:hypothetical protein
MCSLKVPERNEKCFWVSSSVKEKTLFTPIGREWATPKTANVGGEWENSGIRILPLLSANGILGGKIRGYRLEQFLIFRIENYPWRRMNHKLANGMKIWNANGNTTTLLFSPKGLEILHQERRWLVDTLLMEHFESILSHKSGPINKQHTNQSHYLEVKTAVFLFHILELRAYWHYFP